MTKLQIDQLLIPLMDVYSDIELDLIKNILERIDNYTSVRGSLEWYVDKLAELGALDKDNLKIIKSNKNKLKEVITELLNNTGRNVDNLELFQEYYSKGLIEVNPLEIYNSSSINNLINNAIKDSENILDLINTKALEGAKETYKEILNKAYIETASGIYTYDEAIRRALKDYEDKGIRTIHYESGRTLSIEAVVRRDVVTRMNKLVGDIELQRAKELDTNLVYVDQHLGARVRTEYMKHDYEAHAEWQGKVYMIDGSSNKYDNLYEKTGYGEMLGLKGINCYHNMRPYFEWEKMPKRIDEVENAKAYEILQQKRKFERTSRKIKREKQDAKFFNETDELKKINKKQKQFNKKYNDWLKENNLTREYNREYVVSR